MRTVAVPRGLLCLIPTPASAVPIIAGTVEDKMFQRITVETNADAKQQHLADFERQFPQSKVLPGVYLAVIDFYQQKGDRLKVIECCENLLRLDDGNLTAMMVLSRNYALERKNLDRAVWLAQRAVGLIVTMKAEPMPERFTESYWKHYLQTAESAAQSILHYAEIIHGQSTASEVSCR